MKLLRSLYGALAFTLCGALAAVLALLSPTPAQASQTTVHNADPSVIRVGSTYISAESSGGGIAVREASSPDALGAAAAKKVWSDTAGRGEVWAPEIVVDGGRYYIYFSSGTGSAHRMYVISSATANSGYGGETKLALPDDKWAIDGNMFTFNGQRWFVWSGWAGDTNVEQNLYVARMSSPTAPTGARYIISQPRESWERVVGNPYINEAPAAIKDPNGQLHIVYSANGSWSDQYCMADLRLRAGGDPTYVWDWYKSNGCLFGANGDLMMDGWDPTLHAKGVGHHSFVLVDGDPDTSPPAGQRFPLAYHGVPIGDDPDVFWDDRYWYAGTFQWWGDIAYARGADHDTGWSLKFFE